MSDKIPSGIGHMSENCGHLEDMPQTADLIEKFLKEISVLRASLTQANVDNLGLRQKLEEVSKILDRGGWSLDAEMLCAQALSTPAPGLPKAVDEAVKALVEVDSWRGLDGDGISEPVRSQVKEALEGLGRFV